MAIIAAHSSGGYVADSCTTVWATWHSIGAFNRAHGAQDPIRTGSHSCTTNMAYDEHSLNMFAEAGR